MSVESWTYEEQGEEMPTVVGPAPTLGYDTHLLSLQLQMTQASLCHEYARMEHRQSVCVLRRGELEEEMAAYHETYEDAKRLLGEENQALVTEVEQDLLCQKQVVFADFDA